jgi:putative phage-type endonuclease
MTTTEPIATDDRAAWLAARKTFIGGSEVAAVLAMSPWATPLDVWANKRSLVPEQAETIAMSLGNELEGWIARRWLDGGDGMRNEQFCISRGAGSIRLDGHPHIAATPDRFVCRIPELTAGGEWEHDEPVGLLECKLVGSHMRSHWQDDNGEHRPPLYVRAQAQLQMAVTGLPWCDICSLHADGWDYQVWREHRDDGTIATIVDLLDQWWAKHVVEGERPELDGRPDKVTKALEAIYAEPDDGATVEASDDLAGKVFELGRLKALRKVLDRDIDTIENDIRAAIGDATKLTYAGEPKPIATWTVEQRRRIDLDALRQHHPDIARDYTTVTRSRTLRTFPQRVQAPF